MNIRLYWTSSKISDINSLIKISPFYSSSSALYKNVTAVHTDTAGGIIRVCNYYSEKYRLMQF